MMKLYFKDEKGDDDTDRRTGEGHEDDFDSSDVDGDGKDELLLYWKKKRWNLFLTSQRLTSNPWRWRISTGYQKELLHFLILSYHIAYQYESKNILTVGFT